MTKKLAELLNLAPVPDDPSGAETQQFISDHQDAIVKIDLAIDKIDHALPLVRDLEAGDAELDELANLAKDKFEDLIDLGMGVEPRFSGVILQTAGTLLGHAITAKTAKMDKKLRMIQLQLQKARLDHQISKDAKNTDEEPLDGQGQLLDRNDLLRQILARPEK